MKTKNSKTQEAKTKQWHKTHAHTEVGKLTEKKTANQNSHI